MPLFAQRLFGNWNVIASSFFTEDADGEAYHRPHQWLDSVDAAEREANGVFEVNELPPQPVDCIVTGTSLTDVDGRPFMDWTCEPHTVEDARALHWGRAKVYRDACMNGGCATPVGVADTDPDSQRKVSGAVTAALVSNAVGQPYHIDFTMQDNSVVSLDASGMIGLGMAIAGHISMCQNAGTAIRLAIKNASTAEAVFGVDVTAGYPV